MYHIINSIITLIIYHDVLYIYINYGFKDNTNLPRDLAKCSKYGIDIEAIDTSYFIGKESLIIKSGTNMNLVRKNIFVTLFRSAENITNQFHLPVNRVVELGSQVLF